MHFEKDQFLSGYPDPSFALDMIERAENASRSSSDQIVPSLALGRMIECFDYPDPSFALDYFERLEDAFRSFSLLGLVAVEEEELAFA